MGMKVTPLPQALGARVEDLDLSAGLDEETSLALRRAWLDHQVLFFPGLALTDEQHILLGSAFGALAATTTGGGDHRRHHTLGPNGEILVLDGSEPGGRANAWHTDVTFVATPPLGSLLSMQVCPDRGGDTLWSNQYAAYDALSPATQRYIDELHAVHGRPGVTDSTTHPVVITHPETGRRALYVNRGWTTRVVGLSQIESSGVLAMLCDHAERPEFSVRWTWTAGDAAMWDNRCTMHYAIDDYGTAARILHRVTMHEPAAAG